MTCGVIIATLLVLGCGCSGTISEPGGMGAGPNAGSADMPRPPGSAPAPNRAAPPGSGGASGTMGTATPTAAPLPITDPNAAGRETTLLRLPKTVYGAALTAILRPVVGNVDIAAPIRSAPDDDAGPSGFFDPGAPSSGVLRSYMEAAEKVLDGWIANPANVPCIAETGAKEIPCIEAWIGTTGRRAYRRPLAADEIADLRAQYTTTRDLYDRPNAIATVLETLAVSPHTVFAIEGARSTAKGDIVPIDGWELGTRLAISLWGTVPDDALLDSVARGDLDTPGGVDTVVRQMSMDKRLSAGLRTFASQWLHFSWLPADAFDLDAGTEAAALLEEVVLRGDARLATIFTTPSVPMTPRSAARYGATAPAGSKSDTYVRGDLPAPRAGILMLSGFLQGNGSATASPIKRGKVIRERLLCQSVPPPPPDVPPLLAATKATTPTLRGRLEQHRADPACGACHSLIDPIGFALENFDMQAKFQSMDAKVPVDVRGELKGTDVDGTVDGPGALVDRLAKSRNVKDCAATQWYRYALGRREDGYDAAELAKLKDAFAKSDGNLRDLLVATAKTDAYRSRRTREIAK